MWLARKEEMSRTGRATGWVRSNAGVLSLIVAVFMFIGGALGGIIATARYFSTLATTDDVTTAVAPLGSLGDTVTDLQVAVASFEGSVNSLNTLSNSVETLSNTVTTLSRMVDTLSGSFQDLEGSFQDLEGSFQDLDMKYSELASCVIELHGPWTEGADVRPFRSPEDLGPSELPTSCDSARGAVDPQVVSGR